MSKCYKFLQTRQRSAAADRGPCHLDPFPQVPCLPSCNEPCGGIQQHDIFFDFPAISKNLPDDFGVSLRIASLNPVYGSALQAEILRSDIVRSYLPIPDFGDFGFAGDGDLVKAVQPMHDESAPHTQFAQHLGHHVGQPLAVYAQ